jgi:hypothetical protein
MRPLSPAGEHVINEIARRHGFSVDATRSMLEAISHGNGAMAQFDHPEFAGPGQWMRGGMTMVSDMFNNGLKSRIDALCSDLAKVTASEPDLPRSGSFQSQSQGGARGGAEPQVSHSGTARALSTGGAELGDASVFVPPLAEASSGWWPRDLGSPDSTGVQDGARYAYFAQARRLAIDIHGKVVVYDTRDHRITGFSQQQSVGGTLSFFSQHGLVDVAGLPRVG